MARSGYHPMEDVQRAAAYEIMRFTKLPAFEAGRKTIRVLKGLCNDGIVKEPFEEIVMLGVGHAATIVVRHMHRLQKGK